MVFLRGFTSTCRGVGRQVLGSTSWGIMGAPPSSRPYAWGRKGTCKTPQIEPKVGGVKVTICGAAGCTGQPLALLLKQCPLIDELALYDQCAICGLGVELSHVDTMPKVQSYSGRHMLCEALKDSTIVVIVAKGPSNTFEDNAPILTEIALQICNVCPKVECITSCIMCATEAVAASKGCCTATPFLAGAFAIARVTTNVLKAMKGEKITQCAYVDSLGYCAPDVQFFASEVILGPSGIEKNLGVPELTKFENCLLLNSIPYIRNEQARACWLVYTMCQQCCSPCCCMHPCTCYSMPQVPCVPPTNWTCECPDACRDEYLASVCREMTCRCGSTELCWRPRPADFDAYRALQFTHQMPIKGGPCTMFKVPRSVAMQQQIQEKARSPCTSNY